MIKVETLGIFLVLAATVTATTAVMLTTQSVHAVVTCITGKSGAKICSDGSVTGASGATITPNCVTGVTGVTLCGF